MNGMPEDIRRHPIERSSIFQVVCQTILNAPDESDDHAGHGNG